MTDKDKELKINKLDPGWVSDRLPIKEDGDSVIVFRQDGFGKDMIRHIKEGETWCRYPDKWRGKDTPVNWFNLIATPEECLAREQLLNQDPILTASQCSGKLKDKEIRDLEETLEKAGKRLADLEKALAESEERYRSLEIDTTKLKEYLNKEEAENDILWKLLKIYKFGDD